MSQRQKIWIDTDIGDDIDDAFALYCAMRQSFDIVGVTTVYRDTVRRARMVKKLLACYGNGYEACPVYAGYDLYGTQTQTEYPPFAQYSDELDAPEYLPDGTEPDEAVDALLDACKQYGQELTVVAIGPFGNIATALERDPEALQGVGRVVVMGGAFFKQYTDWNVMCDVPAADVMLRTLSNLECLGADVTHLLAVEGKTLDAVLYSQNQTACVRELRRLYGIWKREKPNAPFVVHDALVMHYLADPTLCGMEAACIHLFTKGYAKGLTLNVDAYRHTFLNDAYREFDFSHKTLVARTVDKERFMQAFANAFEA